MNLIQLYIKLLTILSIVLAYFLFISFVYMIIPVPDYLYYGSL